MGIEDVWLQNLRALVGQLGGGNDRKGYRAIADRTGLNEEYISQMAKSVIKADGRTTKVGKRSAAKIAREFADGRDPGWFDRLPETENPTGSGSKGDLILYETTVPRTVTWESLMSAKEPPESFVVALPDDALAPIAPRGTRLIFERGGDAQPGDGVLVQDAAGSRYVRRFAQGVGTAWTAQAVHTAYVTLESDRDGLVVLARMTGRLGSQLL